MVCPWTWIANNIESSGVVSGIVSSFIVSGLFICYQGCRKKRLANKIREIEITSLINSLLYLFHELFSPYTKDFSANPHIPFLAEHHTYHEWGDTLAKDFAAGKTRDISYFNFFYPQFKKDIASSMATANRLFIERHNFLADEVLNDTELNLIVEIINDLYTIDSNNYTDVVNNAVEILDKMTSFKGFEELKNQKFSPIQTEFMFKKTELVP